MAEPNLVNVTSIFGKTVGGNLNTTLTTSLLANATPTNYLKSIYYCRKR